jgi:predicted GNAT superfamily acetyltransferase
VIEIRALTARAELEEAVRLQKTIWGFAEMELLPVRLFVVATKVGGQVFGAFDGPAMIGFLLAIPGLKPGGEFYLHSHMMGVLPEYRNQRVGRMLKFRQRDDALARGIPLVEWTFDPLEIKNAFFNIERLGAVVKRYVLNQYGTTTSHLHGGLPTDRCVAEWHLDSPRVQAVITGVQRQRLPVEVRIPVPAEIEELRKTDPARAREMQQKISNTFQEAFERGLTCIGFEMSDAGGTYLLARGET